MRKKPNGIYTPAMLVVFLLLSGCVSNPGSIEPMPRSDDYRLKPVAKIFKPVDVNNKITREHYRQKTSRLIILVDKTVKPGKSSEKAYSNPEQTQENLLATLPDRIPYRKIIKTFGIAAKGKQDSALTLSGILDEINAEINPHDGITSIIVLTRWEQINEASVKAADKLFDRYGAALCLHMIGIGNIHADKRLVPTGYCGSAESDFYLRNPGKMARFVENVFFDSPVDSDGDGIFDYHDKCPGTPPDTIITWDGCPRDSRTSNARYRIEPSSRSNR